MKRTRTRVQRGIHLVEEDHSNEPMLRLLLCMTCKSIEELPDYQGDAEHDVTLAHLVGRHRFADDREHEGGALLRVEQRHWSAKTTREAIVRQIRQGSMGLNEIDADYYATTDTFKEDALRCFSAHRRPEDGCIDWETPERRIGTEKSNQRVYLCHWCPVSSHYVDRKKQNAGEWTP